MSDEARRIYRRFAWGFVLAGALVVVGFLTARVTALATIDGRPETVGLFLMVIGEALRRTVRADERTPRSDEPDAPPGPAPHSTGDPTFDTPSDPPSHRR